MIIPSNAQTYSKSNRYFTQDFKILSGLGCKVQTDDGRELTDYSMGLGANILGYKSASWYSDGVPDGINFSRPHPLEEEVASKLLEYFPHHDMVKFFKNGSDATEIAVRLARAYKGVPEIFYMGYHGFHDSYIASVEPHKGIPTNYIHDNWKCGTANDFAGLMGKSTAGVIVEPTHPDIREISKIAKENNIVLIFDEVLTGFRYDLGGWQKLIGIEPDITCLGKCMANGLPLSAVVGNRDLMKLMDEGVFASSTMGGETMSLYACLKTIKELEVHSRWLWTIGNRWRMGAFEVFTRHFSEMSFQSPTLDPRCGFDFKNLTQQSIYQYELLKRGILTNGLNNFCLAHTTGDIDYYIECLEEVLPIVKKGEYNGRIINPMFKK